jgi:hypothetical protein
LVKISTMKSNNGGITKLLLEYTLDRTGMRAINWVINHELEREEKIEILLQVDEERAKQILRNLGFDEDFVKTL